MTDFSIVAFGSGIASNIIVGIIGFLSGRLWNRLRERRHLSHFSIIVQNGQPVHVVLPQLPMRDWQVPDIDAIATQPPNVPVMPMAEGGAMARIASAINTFRKDCTIEYVTCRKEGISELSSFCIGGPSVNQLSATILREHFPKFKLVYPEHEAHYDSIRFIPNRTTDGSLKDDYGFIFVAHRPTGKNVVVLCGVWGTGTEMAARMFIDLRKNSEAAKLLQQRRNCLFVVHGEVAGVSGINLRLVQMHLT